MITVKAIPEHLPSVQGFLPEHKIFSIVDGFILRIEEKEPSFFGTIETGTVNFFCFEMSTTHAEIVVGHLVKKRCTLFARKGKHVGCHDVTVGSITIDENG